MITINTATLILSILLSILLTAGVYQIIIVKFLDTKTGSIYVDDLKRSLNRTSLFIGLLTAATFIWLLLQ